MQLIEYLNELPPSEREQYAAAAGTTVGYLRKACSVGQSIGPELCVGLEQHSKDRKVTRQELRPDDWHRIWPELAQTANG